MDKSLVPPIALLDTNVLFPVGTRDILLWFGYYKLFTPRWSSHILAEWKEVMLRKHVDPAEILLRMTNVNTAFPNAPVQTYTALIDTLTLPDPKDRHVLAAAIACRANCIVTNNLKDFPADYLRAFGLEAQSADRFLSSLISQHPKQTLRAFKEMVAGKKNPPMSVAGVIAQLQKATLEHTASALSIRL